MRPGRAPRIISSNLEGGNDDTESFNEAGARTPDNIAPGDTPPQISSKLQ